MGISADVFESVRKKIAEKAFASQSYSSTLNGFRYLRYRMLRPLLKFRYHRFQRKHADWPWLAPDAIKALELLLSTKMKGFEYGSGRSTLFFAKRIRHLTSVEHSEDWFRKVQADLQTHQIDNTHLLLAPPENTFDYPNLSSLDHLRLSAEQYPVKDSNYASYINTIDRFKDGSLDFVIVDGRARVSCTKKAIAKLKPGGLLVLDNSERNRYSEAHTVLKDWPKMTWTTGLTNTTIWLKAAWT